MGVGATKCYKYIQQVPPKKVDPPEANHSKSVSKMPQASTPHLTGFSTSRAFHTQPDGDTDPVPARTCRLDWRMISSWLFPGIGLDGCNKRSLEA